MDSTAQVLDTETAPRSATTRGGMMFPPTADRLADAAKVHQPIHDTSPGAAWLMATAARAAEVQQQLAEGHNRATLVTLHAHYAVEDPSLDPCMVAADLHVPLHHRGRTSGQQFAASVALFRVARGLLDRLTAPEPDVLGHRGEHLAAGPGAEGDTSSADGSSRGRPLDHGKSAHHAAVVVAA
jgi:hypothetical protein